MLFATARSTITGPFRSRALRALGAALGAACAAGGASAQCPGSWVPVDGLLGAGPPGTNGPVYASTAWDPDGSGPLPTHLVVGGEFTLVGTTFAASVAMYNPSTQQWAPLAKGLDGTVLSLAVDPAGNLVAGGRFTAAGNGAPGDAPAANIARFNRSTARWEAMGPGLTAPGAAQVSALAVFNGSLYAGGVFTASGTTAVSGVARWNTSTNSWAPLGTGVTGIFAVPRVNALAADATSLYVGGMFTTAGGQSRMNIARWDGSSWAPTVGSPNFTQEVVAIQPYSGGVAVAGFTPTGFLVRSLSPSSGAWTTLGGTLYNFGTSAALAVFNGELYLGGWLGNGQTAFMLGRLSGGAWVPASPDGPVSALTLTAVGNRLYAGGSFLDIGSVKCQGVASVDSAGTWRALATGGNRKVTAVAATPSGDLIVGGEFVTAGGVTVNNVARYSPATGQWSAMGSGVDGPVMALLVLPDGDVLVGGAYGWAGSVQANGLARWSPTSGWRITAGVGYVTSGFFTRGSVFTLALRHDGRVVVGGSFRYAGGVLASNIALYNPSAPLTSAWSALNANIIDGQINAVTALPNGEIIAAGYFSCLGGTGPVYGPVDCASGVRAYRVARWDGTRWHPFGSATASEFPVNPMALTTTASGEVVAGGDPVTGLARVLVRTGSGWGADTSTSIPLSVMALGKAAGAGFAAGGSGGSSGPKMVARRLGSSTAPLSNDTRGVTYAMTTLPNGDIALGGTFATVGNAPSVYLAIWRDANKPEFVETPAPAGACASGATTFSAGAIGAGEVAYQWQVKTGLDSSSWFNLSSAPLTLPCGATATASSPTSAGTTVAITPCAGSTGVGASFKVRVVASIGGCGQTPSPEADYRICRADHSCTNGVDLLDIFAFLEDWFAGSTSADFNTTGQVELLDIFDFLQSWFDGC